MWKSEILCAKQFFFGHHALQSLGSFSNVVVYRSQEKYKKNEFTTYFEQKFIMAHTKLKFDVLGVARKLVKYIHSSKNKRLEIYFSSYIVPKQKTTSFLSQGILGINMKNEHLNCLLQIAKNSK